MTSTANAVPSGNVASAKATPPSNPTARTTMKASAAVKSSDTGRKQVGSPADAAPRPVQQAWGSGTNPITQKPTPQTNGTQSSQRPSQQNVTKESNTADQHAHDRLLFICAASIGLSVTITTQSGDAFNGIMSSSVLNPTDQSITMKMVQKAASGDSQTNGATQSTLPYLGSGSDHAMTFEFRDIANLTIPDLPLSEVKKTPNGASTGFRTDADISGSREAGERTLQRWVPDASSGADMSLESGGSTGWDQFAVNEEKFGTKSTYDENIYTTAINRNDPTYKRREAAAAKLAREIEGSASNNMHIREERGQAMENDGEDEEAKYSGVRRAEAEFPPLSSGQPNKYTPPARRAPTGLPTVAGAPVDPAIISAQMSHPEGSTRQTKPQSKLADSAQLEPANLDDHATPADAAAKVADSERLAVDEGPSAGKIRSINTSVSPHRKLPGTENATEGVEKELLNQFRSFANSEKQKMQERRRVQANQDRTAKLNELLRFSKNFKLNTPVPKDLVPILAKDPEKQEKIIEKAQKQTEEKKVAPPPAVTADSKIPSRPSGSGRYDSGTMPALGASDRQNFARSRPGYPPTGPMGGQGGRSDKNPQPQMTQPRGSSGMMTHRMSAQPGKPSVPATIPTPIPVDGRILPSGPSVDTTGLSSPQRSTMQTPTSAISSKFNVGAIEFRPNPSASTFNPRPGSQATSSPRSAAVRTRSASRAPSPTSFFGSRKPVPSSERKQFSSFFNPIKRMKKESEGLPQGKNYASNGGIPEPYRTQVRWDVPDANIDKTYRDFVDKNAPPSVSPSARSNSSSQIPYQHQLPGHLQNGASNIPPNAPQGPQTMQPQHSHQGHFHDHHRMEMSGTPQVYPSPRVPQAHMVYQSPMAGQPQMYGQPQPQYYNQQGTPVPMQMRGYGGTPQFVQAQPVPMMNQQSQPGQYMGVPQQFNAQMQMYSPNPGQVYPAHVTPQPHSGYPSPSRGAPMMMHQGSQQGHHPQGVMYVSPNQHGQPMYNPQQHMPNMRPGYPTPSAHYSASPHQPHHFPPTHRAPSSGYGQIPQKPAHMNSQPQGPPQMPASYSGDNLADDGGK